MNFAFLCLIFTDLLFFFLSYHLSFLVRGQTFRKTTIFPNLVFLTGHGLDGQILKFIRKVARTDKWSTWMKFWRTLISKICELECMELLESLFNLQRCMFELISRFLEVWTFQIKKYLDKLEGWESYTENKYVSSVLVMEEGQAWQHHVLAPLQMSCFLWNHMCWFMTCVARPE